MAPLFIKQEVTQVAVFMVGCLFSNWVKLAIFQSEWMWAWCSEELKIVVRGGAKMGAKFLIMKLGIPSWPMDLFSFITISLFSTCPTVTKYLDGMNCFRPHKGRYDYNTKTCKVVSNIFGGCVMVQFSQLTKIVLSCRLWHMNTHTHIHTHTYTHTHTHTQRKYTKHCGFIIVPNKCGTENICIFKKQNTFCKMTMITNACGISAN